MELLVYISNLINPYHCFIVHFIRWSIQHEPCKRQYSTVSATLSELSEVKELGSNSSSEKSSQQDEEDLTMEKKRSSTSSAQVGVCVVVLLLDEWLKLEF